MDRIPRWYNFNEKGMKFENKFKLVRLCFARILIPKERAN